MTALAIDQRLERPAAVRSHAVQMLQLFAVTVMVFPSSFVLKAVGGGGYPGALVAYCLFFAWVAATLFGLHNPLDHRSPVRIALCVLWLASLASYVVMDRTMLSTTQLTGADRWLLRLVGVSGVVLVASECLHSLEDIRRVLRALTWGGAFCGIVAALQFRLRIDLTHYLHLPGFTMNQALSAYSDIQDRAGQVRVVGTAVDPIELGVSAGMLMPLAVYMGIYDVKHRGRWIPVLCIALAIPASVSRSAILAVSVGMTVLIASLAPIRRVSAFALIPVAVAGVFLTAHGLIGTLISYFFAGTNDNSIAHRVNNYPYVEKLIREAPWFGQGGGTYIPVNSLHIFDNQYLTTAVELGLVGAVALIFYLLWPAIAALAARARSSDQELRDLSAALAGAAFAAALCSVTFDSLSFQMFVNVQALVVGLIGATWLLASPKLGGGY